MASSLRPYASIGGTPRSSRLDRTATAARCCILHEGTVLLLVVCSVLDLKTSDALLVRAAPLGMGFQGAMHGLDGRSLHGFSFQSGQILHPTCRSSRRIGGRYVDLVCPGGAAVQRWCPALVAMWPKYLCFSCPCLAGRSLS